MVSVYYQTELGHHIASETKLDMLLEVPQTSFWHRNCLIHSVLRRLFCPTGVGPVGAGGAVSSRTRGAPARRGAVHASSAP